MAQQNDAFEMKEGTSKSIDDDKAETASQHSKANGITGDVEQGISSMSTEKKPESVVLPSKPFAGMGKDELLQFSQTPGWRAARWVCLLIVLAGWCAMLGVAIWLIVSTPRCLPWWQSAVVYQIYPRSFKDSSTLSEADPKSYENDGIGDLRGITDNVEYLKSLGINAVLLNSIYKSGGMANGEDIVDFTDVDPDLGTIDDFMDLVGALHNADIKVILDFIPNHSSVNHEFFNNTRDLFDDPLAYNPSYQEYYTLTDPGQANNWVSQYSGSAWDCDQLKDKCFLHQYSSYQADFNLSYEPVIQHLTDALEVWFTRGVDGFNIRGVKYFFEDTINLPDEPNNPQYDPIGSTNAQYDSLLHYYTAEYNGASHEILRSWKDSIFYQFSTAGTYRVMLTDSDSNATYVQSYYGTSAEPEADLPMNFLLLGIGHPQGMGGEVTGQEIEDLIKNWMEEMAKTGSGQDNWPNFQIGNYASRRITSRLSPLYAKVANMLLLTLPGTPLCYYGDELGMLDLPFGSDGLEFGNTRDQLALSDPDVWQLKTRDPERSPMQWDATKNAGFSEAETADLYLPVNPTFETINKEAQELESDSVLNLFRRMVTLRSENRALTSREITFIASSNEVVSYVRALDSDKSRFFVALNFGSANSEMDYYHTGDGTALPLQGTVVVATNVELEGSRVELNQLALAPGEGVVVLLDEIVQVGSGFWYKFYTPKEN